MLDAELLLKPIGPNKPLADQATFEQQRTQERQALGDHLTVVRREPPLGPPLSDLLRQSMGERPPRQASVKAASRKVHSRDGQA